MPAPFRGREFTFTQHNGSQLKVRGFGNPFRARFETSDGQPVVRDPATGFYRPAPESATREAFALNDIRGAEAGSGQDRRRTRWEERREERRQEAALAMEAGVAFAPTREIVGQLVGLCLLIDFIPDPAASPQPAAIPQAEVEAFCNRRGYSGFGNRGSVRDYFLDNSADRLDYTNIVTPYYRTIHPRAHYSDPAIAWPIRAMELVEEALAHHKAAGFDFSGLTADNMGYLRALNIFYAGNLTDGSQQGLWPHSSSLPTPVELIPGLVARDYQITNMGSELTLGTFCHENGHMICDFPEIYDVGEQSVGTGDFCLMGYGGDADEKNPTQICAYLKHQAGWTERLTHLTPGRMMALAADRNDFAIFERSATEYFILENRQKAGRDLALPDAGLAIWHVDEWGSNENEQMTPTMHYECSLEQADGRFDLERRKDAWGDADDLFPFGRKNRFGDATRPNSKWWDGTSSGLEIRSIRSVGGSVTFVVKG